MGYNTSLVVLNDALSHIENDNSFGTNIARAVRMLHMQRPVDIASGNFMNAAWAIETHHSSHIVPVLVGANLGVPVEGMHLGGMHVPALEEQLLRRLAEKYHYRLVRKGGK